MQISILKFSTHLFLGFLCINIANAVIENLNAERSVDLMEQGSNLVTFQNSIQFSNDGTEKFYYFTVAKDYQQNIAAIQAFTAHPKEKGRAFYLKHEKIDRLPDNLILNQNISKLEDNLIIFKIQLPNFQLGAGAYQIQVNEVHKSRREPYPKVIKVFEKQKVELYESKYYLSVYQTKSSKLILNIKQSNIHYTSEKPTESDSEKVVYSFKNIEPLQFQQLQLFFTYPFPLPKFSQANRDIYVSHWGQVSIDEYFNIFNEAAGINGQFSRVDYMPHINPSHGQNAINSMGISLPRYIHGLYYYDYIGNISSSHAQRTSESVEFQIDPRFPIFGQWKTDWNQGYNMPTEYHLFQEKKDTTQFILEVDFMHAFDKSIAEDYVVKVTLPEGARNIRLELASDINPDSIELGKYFGTLDYFGRPQLIIKKKNAVHEICDSTIRIKYNFTQNDLYLEPACMVGLVFSLFLAAIIYSRVGLSLEDSKYQKQKSGQVFETVSEIFKTKTN